LTEAQDEYELREKQLMEKIRNVDPVWLESDSVPQSLQFMIDILPTIRRLTNGWPKRRILRVLDVGAASGAGSNLLATMHSGYFFEVKMSVDALDTEPRFKPYADQHFPKIKYIVGNIHEFDKTATWDLIICSHTLEHIPDYQSFVSELQRRARYWVLIYSPYDERHRIAVHVNSFNEDTFKDREPIISQLIESPGWRTLDPDEIRKCILVVMKGFAFGESII
jgi:2-polyprenyl-3-methyl-5-hydroxy-6-metoxy-1,4-benzoquinol methylase